MTTLTAMWAKDDAAARTAMYRDALERIASRAPQLDSMEIGACFRELREITAIAQNAITAGQGEKS